MKISHLILCANILLLAACASMPGGPSVLALPPKGKNFDQFAGEQETCKAYAAAQVQTQADDANSTGVLQGVGGTLLGAGLGAAIGGGQGAAIGAAGGATAGTLVGAGTSGDKQRGIQQQYDNAYIGCMVSKGNKIERPAAPARTVIYQQPPTVVYAPPPPVVYEAYPY